MKTMNKKSPKGGMLKMQKDKPMEFLNDSEWYVGKLVEHTVEDGMYGPFVKMTFQILSGETENGNDAKGKKINAMMDATLSPKSKLYPVVKALMGKEPPMGKTIDLKAYYGKKVKIFIEDKKKKNDDGKRYQNVTKVKPLAKKA